MKLKLNWSWWDPNPSVRVDLRQELPTSMAKGCEPVLSATPLGQREYVPTQVKQTNLQPSPTRSWHGHMLPSVHCFSRIMARFIMITSTKMRLGAASSILHPIISHIHPTSSFTTRDQSICCPTSTTYCEFNHATPSTNVYFMQHAV